MPGGAAPLHFVLLYDRYRVTPGAAGQLARTKQPSLMDPAGAASRRERITVDQTEEPDALTSTTDDLDVLIKQLVVARNQRALSQRRLSLRLGLDEMVVGRWEAGVDVPATRNFVRWAAMLGLGIVLLDPVGAPVQVRPDPLPQESFEHFEVRRMALALKSVRVDASFTQKALGAELDVNTHTILMWETYRRGPRLGHLFAWADRLSCRLILKQPHLHAAVLGCVCGCAA